MPSSDNIAVFVHLALNKNVDAWRKALKDDKLVGINDRTPYGYGRAENMGCTVCFSRVPKMDPLVKALRLFFRGLLGFDFIYAWLHRDEFAKADIIWTHTESQFLAVAATLLLTRQNTILLGQVVWLMDSWDRLSIAHKWLYRRLLKRVNVVTFLSTKNWEKAQKLFPDRDLRVVPFGIMSEEPTEVKTSMGDKIRILSLGNDRHRDWETLARAVAGQESMSLVILSDTAPRQLTRYGNNIEIRLARSNAEMKQEFANADVVCVPLKPNLHASGITVIQEAVLCGVPVIATDTGGLELYFSNREITYTPVGDVSALTAAIEAIRKDPAAARVRAMAAQERMADRENSGAHAYIKRHVAISRELLSR